MKGSEYADSVAKYIATTYGCRGVLVFREVSFGRTLVGKKRFLDVLVVHLVDKKAFAIECKYQDSSGSADEKLLYALENIKVLPISGCVVYAGTGFSDAFRSLLERASNAAYCYPEEDKTGELDHLLSVHFGWWDTIVEGLSAVGAKDEDKLDIQ